MRYEFLSSLEGILEESFDVLDGHYDEFRAAEVVHELAREIDNTYEVRYLLIDGQTGQLETRTLFESEAEAMKWAESLSNESYSIGTLLVETLPPTSK